MKDPKTEIDLGKRRTMKCLAGTTAAAISMTTLPVFALDAAGPSETTIDATLISIPGTQRETIILKNPNDQPVAISQLKDATLSFDSETIDCGAVCEGETLVIPAKQDIMVHFHSSARSAASGRKSTVPSMNVQAQVRRLPEGTRVVPFKARLHGSKAIAISA